MSISRPLHNICPVLVISREMGQAHLRSSVFFRFERWRFVAAANAGYLSSAHIKSVCEENGWKIGTEIKAIRSMKRYGWVNDTSTGYHFKSGYRMLAESKLRERFPENPFKSYEGADVVRVEGKRLLGMTHAQFKGVLEEKFIIDQLKAKQAMQAVCAGLASKIKNDGFYVSKVVDRSTGEQTTEVRSGEDFDRMSAKYADRYEFDLTEYAEKIESDRNQGVTGGEGVGKSISKEKTRFSVEVAEPSFVFDQKGNFTNSNGKLYTEFTRKRPENPADGVQVNPVRVAKKTKNKVYHPQDEYAEGERILAELEAQRDARKATPPVRVLRDTEGILHIENMFNKTSTVTPAPITEVPALYKFRVYDGYVAAKHLADDMGISKATACRHIKKGLSGNSKTRQTVVVLTDHVDSGLIRHLNGKLETEAIPHDLRYKATVANLGRLMGQKRKEPEAFDLYFQPIYGERIKASKGAVATVLQFKTHVTTVQPQVERPDLPDRLDRKAAPNKTYTKTPPV